MPVDSDPSPREHWAAVEAAYGRSAVVGWCAALLCGEITTEHADHAAFDALGRGGYLDRILAGRAPDYWIRVWAARGLLYVWDDAATAAVLTGLTDEHWRVREMSAKVCRRRALGQAGDVLGRLIADPVPRVRLAAVRAVAEIGEVDQAGAVRTAGGDPDRKVAAAADRALVEMSCRLDRDLCTDPPAGDPGTGR